MDETTPELQQDSKCDKTETKTKDGMIWTDHNGVTELSLNSLPPGDAKYSDTTKMPDANKDEIIKNDHHDEEVTVAAEESSHPEKLMQRKLRMIMRALKDRNPRMMKLAAVEENGLLCDEVRRKVWPGVVGVSIYETCPRPTTQDIENHPYYSQVVLDVNRSLKRFPPSIAEEQRIALQDQLVLLIMRVLIKNPELHYYQGYHDICVTILLVLGEEIGFHVVEKISRNHLRVFMDETMVHTAECLGHIYPLIGRYNQQLRRFLERSEVGVMFCLSWVITWFGHVLNEYDVVVRLFDLFLSSHFWMPIYLSAAIVLYKQEEILQLECELAPVHSYLSKVTDDLPFEELIKSAREMYRDHPPAGLVLEERNRAEEDMKKKKIVPRKRSFPLRCISGIYSGVARRVIYHGWKSTFTAAAAVVVFAILLQVYRNSSNYK